MTGKGVVKSGNKGKWDKSAGGREGRVLAEREQEKKETKPRRAHKKMPPV